MTTLRTLGMYSYYALVFIPVILHAASALETQTSSTPTPTPTPTCIKATLRGDASTYNPNYAGWKTGGQKLSTGGTYNPNSYDAALQLDLAKQYKCGYGSNAICHAIVQSPNGRAMIVRINDNGPLVSGRIIDLNEKSMNYLSGGTKGKNSGIEKNVTVTLLCGALGTFLGPLNPADRDKLATMVTTAASVFTGGMSGGAGSSLVGINAASLFGNTLLGNGSAPSGFGQNTNGFTPPAQQYTPSYQQPNAFTVPSYATTGTNGAVQSPTTPQVGVFGAASTYMGDYGVETRASVEGSEPRATISCTSSEGRTRVQWSCESGASVSRGLASPTDTTFSTRGALAGLVTVNPRALTTYTVQCIKNQQIVGSDSCKLKPALGSGVTTAKKMVLAISADPESPVQVRRGARVSISWSSIRASACTVYGEGFAAEGNSGEGETDPLTRAGSYVYTLECEDAFEHIQTARTRVEVR